jgi:hypothetical protein
MPRAARRRLIVAAAAAIVLILFVWLAWIGYFKRNAIADSHNIGLAEKATLQKLAQLRQDKLIDDPTFRAAAVRMNEMHPQLIALNALADERKAHPWSISAAVQYDRVRTRTVRTLDLLRNIVESVPTTREAQ